MGTRLFLEAVRSYLISGRTCRDSSTNKHLDEVVNGTFGLMRLLTDPPHSTPLLRTTAVWWGQSLMEPNSGAVGECGPDFVLVETYTSTAIKRSIDNGGQCPAPIPLVGRVEVNYAVFGKVFRKKGSAVPLLQEKRDSFRFGVQVLLEREHLVTFLEDLLFH